MEVKRQRLLVCSDIFGHTDVLETWVKTLLPSNWNTQVISPYEDKASYKDESLAYQAFQQCGGLDGYKKRLPIPLLESDTTIIVAFSAGAAAMYQILSNPIQKHSVTHLYGFYPGQIRFFTHLAPNVPTTLYFPQQEPHFEVSTVINQLSIHQGVNCQETSLLHGFMNPYSRNYDLNGEQNYSQILVEQIESKL